MNKNESFEDSIIYDAYYLISLFNNNSIPITQLQVQKLMYIFEAYYMNKENSALYECEYKALPFGPVAPPIYEHFKKYGKNEIQLTDEEKNKGEQITEIKKLYLNNIFDVFKDFKALELVNFTHAKGSPWEKSWQKNQYSIIPKSNIRDWFSKYVESA